MSRVSAATDTALGRDIVVKLLPSGLAGDISGPVHAVLLVRLEPAMDRIRKTKRFSDIIARVATDARAHE